MSNIRDFPSDNAAVEEEAGDWIARLDLGLTGAEELELGRWLKGSARNRRVFMECAQLWDGMDTLSRLAHLFPEPLPVAPMRPRFTVWRIAASVLVVVLAIGALQWGAQMTDVDDIVETLQVQASYETMIGEQSTFQLIDGTEIVLNTNSLVKINFTQTDRLLILVRGEMHVSVAHDPSRRLSVMVGGKVIQAVGTEFNIEITDHQSIELLVTEGVVLVGVLDKTLDTKRDRPIILTREATLVAAGQEVEISTADEDLAPIKTENIESEDIAVRLSWREGNLIFRGESLEAAVSEVGRYTAVQFIFLDDKAKKVKVAGMFRAGDVDELLSALRYHFNISYEWQGDDKILLSAEGE